MRSHDERHGFTLIEILVALGIVAVLLAITIPAVSAVRESSRRVTCKTRLAQMGQALLTFEAGQGKFPGAGRSATNTERDESFACYSVQVQLLPHVDQPTLHNKINFTHSQGPVDDPMEYPAADRFNGGVMRIRVPIFLCPSDPQSSGSRPGNSFRACIGVGPEYTVFREDRKLRGAFSAMIYRRAAEFEDGLSNTAAFSERRMGSWNSGQYDPARDMWYTGVNQVSPVPSADELAELCKLAPSVADGEINSPWGGAAWLVSGFEHTWYNHGVGPNSPIPACSAGVRSRFGAPPAQAGSFGASSYHNGVHLATCDGAVRFVSPSIDLAIWRGLSTIAMYMFMS